MPPKNIPSTLSLACVSPLTSTDCRWPSCGSTRATQPSSPELTALKALASAATASSYRRNLSRTMSMDTEAVISQGEPRERRLVHPRTLHPSLSVRTTDSTVTSPGFIRLSQAACGTRICACAPCAYAGSRPALSSPMPLAATTAHSVTRPILGYSVAQQARTDAA